MFIYVAISSQSVVNVLWMKEEERKTQKTFHLFMHTHYMSMRYICRNSISRCCSAVLRVGATDIMMLNKLRLGRSVWGIDYLDDLSFNMLSLEVKTPKCLNICQVNEHCIHSLTHSRASQKS